jgi:acyl-CoA thioesterase
MPAQALKTDYALLTTQSTVTKQGYSQERDMLWTRDGQLIAMAEQQILVIK